MANYYVTGEEVYDLLLNQKIGPPARLGVDDIVPFIQGIEGQVNGVLLARGYQPVPATHPDAVAVIREMVRKKVAATVLTALNQPVRSPDFVRVWELDFAEWLNRLRLGQEKMPGGDVNPLGDVTIAYFNLNMTEVEDT